MHVYLEKHLPPVASAKHNIASKVLDFASLGTSFSSGLRRLGSRLVQSFVEWSHRKAA
jgi:hypothetical protein